LVETIGEKVPDKPVDTQKKQFGTLRSKEIIRAFLEESEALVAFHIPINPLTAPVTQTALLNQITAPANQTANQTNESTHDKQSVFDRPAHPRRKPGPVGQAIISKIQKRNRDGIEQDELLQMRRVQEAEQDLEQIEKLMAEHSMSSNISSDTIKLSLHPNWKWSSWFSLSSHLDSVRCLAWNKDLFSASEDGTAKMWNITNLMNAARVPTDIEPVFTFRGHVRAVTSLAVAEFNSRSILITASLDSTVRTWQVPPNTRETYAPYTVTSRALVGHFDAVWKVCIQQPNKNQIALVASASADGTVKIWHVTESGEGQLKSSLQTPFTPTSIQWHKDSLLVGYKNGQMVVWDAETASETATISTGSGLCPNIKKLIQSANQLYYLSSNH
jgi:WD40 repeat protein